MRAVHAYKIYRPDIRGGIPHVVAALGGIEGIERLVLVARRFGLRRRFRDGADEVDAVSSLGTLFSTPLAPAYPFALARQARRADLVVHHAPFPLVDIGILLGLRPSTALVVHWHAEIVGKPLLAQLVAPLVRHTLERADRIVVSDRIIAERSSMLAPHVAKCVAVPYGCDVDYWRNLDAAGHEAVQRIKLRSPNLIVAVGRLVGYKGFDVLVRAMQFVDGEAVIIGEGPLLGSLKALAHELGLAGKLTFAGGLPRNEVRTYLHAASAFAFPSVTDAEAFGIAQIEAMAAGLPVVNTALATAVPRIARHGREALTVAPGDPSALAAALRTLLENGAFARQLGSAGYQRARAEFDHGIFVERVAAIYRQEVKRRNAAVTALRAELRSP